MHVCWGLSMTISCFTVLRKAKIDVSGSCVAVSAEGLIPSAHFLSRAEMCAAPASSNTEISWMQGSKASAKPHQRPLCLANHEHRLTAFAPSLSNFNPTGSDVWVQTASD